MILVGRLGLATLRIAVVRGPSMVPTLRDGDRVVVRMRTPAVLPVGRVVVVALPDRPLSVKRLVAVEPDGKVRIEGDNEFASTDSRTLGPLEKDAIRGVVLARLSLRPRRV